MQLAHLKIESERKFATHDIAMGQALSAHFRRLYREAARAGVDLSTLAAHIKRDRDASETQVEKEEIRAREASENEANIGPIWSREQVLRLSDQFVNPVLLPDGRHVVHAESDRLSLTIRDRFDADETSAEKSKIDLHGLAAFRLKLSPDGTKLSVIGSLPAQQGDRLVVISLPDGRTVLDTPGSLLSDPSFSADGRFMAVDRSGSPMPSSPVVDIFDLTTGALQSVVHAKPNIYRRLALSADGKTLASSGYDWGKEMIEVFDVASDKLLRTIPTPRHQLTMTFGSSATKLFASHAIDYGIEAFDVTTGQSLGFFKGAAGGMDSIEIDQHGLLAGGSDDGYAYIWDVESGVMLRKFNGPKHVKYVQFAKDESAFIYGGHEEPNFTAHVFDHPPKSK